MAVRTNPLARNGVNIDAMNEDLAYELIITVASGDSNEITDIAESLEKVMGIEETSPSP